MRERSLEFKVGVLIADSSPKFLRVALDKFGDDERVAFRLLLRTSSNTPWCAMPPMKAC